MSKHNRWTLFAAIAVLLTVIWFVTSPSSAATYLQNRFDQLSDSLASATTTHILGFDITDTSVALGSIEFQFCSNDPLPNLPCTAPTGFDLSSATLANQTGNTGFSISPLSTANTMILTRTASLPTSGSNTYQFDSVVNPNAGGTYYVRLYIFPTTDATGPDTQEGGIAFAINSALSVSAEVPPYLKFCAGASLVNFDCTSATTSLVDLGDFGITHSSTGTSQFIVATNAQSGYSVSISGTTLTSGNNIIPALSSPSASHIGTSEFGLNLRANTAPIVGADPQGPGAGVVEPNYGIVNEFTFKSGDEIASTPTASDNQTFTVSYLANVNSSQTAGVYVTTITYICLANF